MKEMEQFNKKMPYVEHEEYLEQLVERCTENALRRTARKAARTKVIRLAIASAAAAIVLLVGGLVVYNQQPDAMAFAEKEDPIDFFLNNLTDEEAQYLSYYDIEEIPEY
ncbi:MAG: hypothetical protein ILA04_09165 [Prevotella sp.]|nr:hypothetical protein [Prevotella sp.]